MQTATLFKNGRSQAVRLPAGLRFDDRRPRLGRRRHADHRRTRLRTGPRTGHPELRAGMMAIAAERQFLRAPVSVAPRSTK